MGQVEEQRLGLRSYKRQIEELAGDIKAGRKQQPEAGRKASVTEVPTEAKVRDGGSVKTVRFEAGSQPIFKRRLRLGRAEKEHGYLGGSVKADGVAFVSERNWQALESTSYVMDPMSSSIYITTAAVRGQDLKLAATPPANPVKTYDLAPELQRWLGANNGTYSCEVLVNIRVGPDENRDTVDRLTQLKQVKARVVESDVPAVILGKDQITLLEERRDESLEFKADRSQDAEAIKHRLEDVLDAARLQGMSEAGLAEGRKMIMEIFPQIWRVSLGPGDFADVPPMKIELEDSDQRLRKPYSKRHTKNQMTWWKKHLDTLCKANILRKSTSKDLSPANLVDKLIDGVARTVGRIQDGNRPARAQL